MSDRAISVADRQRINAHPDPNPSFHFDADQNLDLNPKLRQINK